MNDYTMPQPGKKYFNHMATHSRGEWHRRYLIASGQYTKTSDPDAGRKAGWGILGEAGPELVNLPDNPQPEESCPQ